MFNLLFVDDDPLIAESFRDILDWERMSLNAPYIAYSYAQALQIFADTRIDILVSDIEMFGNNGLDLVEWTSRHYPRTLCCFLTCHARFDYAQRAIQLETHGYLLKPIDEEELEELLAKFVTKLKRMKNSAPAEKDPGQSSLVRSAVSYIKMNLCKTINREAISQELHISGGRLSRIFNQEVGMSISEYITECRVERAMDLLAATNLTITEIGAQVGYNYPAYFTKAFRDKVGLTPHQYRNTPNRNNNQL